MAISAWLTGIYFLVELGIGLWTGSIAVLSDAFHTFSAVGGVLVAILAASLARRPADELRSFGWYRAEIIGALVNGGFLVAMALVVIVMGAMRGGSVCLNRFRAFSKWISASVMPLPLRASAG